MSNWLFLLTIIVYKLQIKFFNLPPKSSACAVSCSKMAAPGDKPKISFSFAKSKKPPLLLQKVPVKVEEKPVEYISYVDDKNLLA